MAMARVTQTAARKSPAFAAAFHSTPKREGFVSTIGGLGVLGILAHPAIPGGQALQDKLLPKDEYKVLAWIGGMAFFGTLASMGGGKKEEAPAGEEGGDDEFAAAFGLDYPPNAIAPGVKKLEGWIQAGCGDAPYNCPEKGATFGIDGKCPDKMPDLSKHSNFMAECMTEEIYDRLKNKVTPGGVTFAECIKTGVDNPGHPHIKTVGLTAGDEDCYEVFKELFDPIISDRHNGYAPDAKQPTNLNIDEISDTDIDPYNKYVLTTRVRTGRSVRGFKLPPVIGFEERRKLEAVAVKGLLNMKDDLKGDYFPLHGSRSYPPKPSGMSEEEEEKLRTTGNLFQEPDSTLLLASGMGRHWPDARGIFCNDNRNLFVWLNEEDHLRIVSMQGSRSECTPEGKQIKEVFARFIRACDSVQKVLQQEGSTFMHNNHH